MSQAPAESEKLRTLLDAVGVARCLDEIAQKIHARWSGKDVPLALVGVYRRGVPFAASLVERLRQLGMKDVSFGRVDITQYRDDLQTLAVLPRLVGSELDFDVDDAVVILCDEVIYTARTTRAALEQLLDYGRPRCVEIAALVDRAGRQFPLYPAYAGITVDLPPQEHVSVRFIDGDGRDEVFVKQWQKPPAA